MNDHSSGINVFGDSKKSVLLSHRIYLSLILCTLHWLSRPPFPFNTHHPNILLWWHPKSVTPLVHIFKTPVNLPYQYRIKWHFVNTFGIDYGLLIDITSSYFIQSNHWKKKIINIQPPSAMWWIQKYVDHQSNHPVSSHVQPFVFTNGHSNTLSNQELWVHLVCSDCLE